MNANYLTLIFRRSRLRLLIFFLAIQVSAYAQKSIVDIQQYSVQGTDSGFVCVDKAVTFIFQTDLPTYDFSTDSLIIRSDFGDGTDSVRYCSPGTSVCLLSFDTFRHTYTVPGRYLPKLYVTNYGKGRDSAIGLLKGSGYVTVKDTCADVKGMTYLDENGNCLKDASEKGFRWVSISAVNTATLDTNVISGTDLNGAFSAFLPVGSYVLFPGEKFPFRFSSGTVSDSVYATCPSSGTASITLGGGALASVNFAAGCKPSPKIDLAATAFSSCAVSGDTGIVSLSAGNIFAAVRTTCTSRSTEVSYTLDARQYYCGLVSGPAPSSVMGKTITWSLSGRDIEDFSCVFKVATDTGAKIGDSVCATVHIDPAIGFTDPDTLNNTYHYCMPVKASFDPNEKQVSPKGIGSAGYIKRSELLTYTIDFQNTGTAAAKVVRIMDTLDPNLDVTSFRVLGASHNVQTFVEGRALKFLFRGINLPDSGANYYGSMGYVRYVIRPKKDIGIGVAIKNRASIYFDYNDPVVTNTTLNTTYIPTLLPELSPAADLIAYPNPFDEVLVLPELMEGSTVTIADMQGRILLRQPYTRRLDTKSLLPGIYLLEVVNGPASVRRKLIHKVDHL